MKSGDLSQFIHLVQNESKDIKFKLQIFTMHQTIGSVCVQIIPHNGIISSTTIIFLLTYQKLTYSCYHSFMAWVYIEEILKDFWGITLYSSYSILQILHSLNVKESKILVSYFWK